MARERVAETLEGARWALRIVLVLFGAMATWAFSSGSVWVWVPTVYLALMLRVTVRDWLHYRAAPQMPPRT